jgi:O-antigen/teichoic acid export membrane protein
MKTPLRNILAVISGDLGSRAIGFFVTMYLARTLLPASFGVINIGLAVLGYLSLLNVPGVQMVEVRNVAATAGDFRERAGSILSFRLVVAPLLLAGTWIVVTAIGMPAETRDAVLLYSLSVVPMALSLDWLFQGREDFRRVSTSRLLSVFLFGIVVLLLVRQEHDVRQTAIAFLMGNIAAALYLGFVYRRLPGHHEHGRVVEGHRAGFPAMKNPCALFPDFDGIPRRGRGFSGITGLRGPPCSSHKA